VIDAKGQTTVEFALVAVVLFTILFAIVDLSVLFYVERTMQFAVREGARYAITGQKTGATGRAEMVDKIVTASNGLYDPYAEKIPPDMKPTVAVLTPSETRNFSNYTGYRGRLILDTGHQNEIIIVSLSYTWQLMTPFVKPFFPDGYTFTTRVTMKNEPWGKNEP
jgi:Flp pilus assembly protein TadG